MAETKSPLIKDGAWSLTATGDLVTDLDIVTQAGITISGYDCSYGDNLNSQLIPYITGIPKGGFNSTAITNIVRSAYTSLVTARIISNLQIFVKFLGISTLNITVNMNDNNGNRSVLSWNNLE
jgi:hypothetical protein